MKIIDFKTVNKVIPVNYNFCIYRKFKRLSGSDYEKGKTYTCPHVSFGKATEVLPFLRRRKNVLFIHMYEVEIPLTLNAVSVKDRASFIKILIEIAVEMYKKKLPASIIDFDVQRCNEIRIGGELQQVICLLANILVSNENVNRLRTLKIAIKNSTEISVLPLVYLCTLSDKSIGVINAYPRSMFYTRYGQSDLILFGQHDLGSKDTGITLSNTKKFALSTCDPLTVKDPRFHVVHAHGYDSFNATTQFEHMRDSYYLQQMQQRKSPCWHKAFCVDLLADIYRNVQNDFLQNAVHSTDAVLCGIEKHNEVMKGALSLFDEKDKDYPALHFLSVMRNCVDAMESVASDIVSAHILSQDLIPYPVIFNRYKLPSLFNSKSLEDANHVLEKCQGDSCDLVIETANMPRLLSAGTKKRARLASLLYKSEEAAKRLETPPCKTRNMKEFKEVKPLQRRIEDNGEVNLNFMNSLSNLFDAHDIGTLEPFVDELQSLTGARLEAVEPPPPPVGIHNGQSSDNCCENGGLPTNELQRFVRAIALRKSSKSKKRKLVYEMLSPDAISTVAILLEELVTEMVLSWRERISSRNASTPPTSSLAKQSFESDGKLFPLTYNFDAFTREINLQIQGADFDEYDVNNVTEVARNRLEILFGPVVNSAENIDLIRERVLTEKFNQEEECRKHETLYREECDNDSQLPRKLPRI